MQLMNVLIITTLYVLGISGLTIQVLKDRKEYQRKNKFTLTVYKIIPIFVMSNDKPIDKSERRF